MRRVDAKHKPKIVGIMSSAVGLPKGGPMGRRKKARTSANLILLSLEAHIPHPVAELKGNF
jgi:hypothetical protein